MMQPLEKIYQANTQLLEAAGISWQSWEHEPILDYATDSRVAAELGWNGEPTKSLFLKLRDGRFCVFLTHRDSRLDSKAMKTLLGSRPSVGSDEQMTEVTGCVPGAVCPFGLPQEVTLVIDQSLCKCMAILWTPGLPEVTFAMPGQQLPDLAEQLPNPVHWL